MENFKVKANQSLVESISTPEQPVVEKLQYELELCGQLYESEQRELDAGLRLDMLKEQQATTEQTIASLHEENANLMQEATQVHQKCSRYAIKLTQLRNTCELAQFCMVDRNIKKWEPREAQLLAELICTLSCTT